jgi:2-succinyl-6-hydroxy-2,4-cyclohexadiene-1-carboxylate synthase
VRETLMLLHGFTQTGSSWSPVIAALDPERYRPLAPDLRGHGTAAHHRPITFEAITADVLGAADGPFVLAGYSQGGRIALHLAARHPERLLTLTVIAAHAGLEGPEREARRAADEALAERIESAGIDWFARYWAARPLFAGLARRGPAFLARLDTSRRRHQPGQLAAALRGLGQGVLPPLWDRLGEIRTPTLVVAGAEDSGYVELAARLASRLPSARLAIVPGAGHAVHLERPQAVAELLAAHLSAADRGPRGTAGFVGCSDLPFARDHLSTL